MRRPKLSIVVPIYNVEAYLEDCLDSILAQPYVDREVVLVDDGSSDSSLQIAQRYASRHPGFVLVSQPNAGLGAARNAGVRAASGEYLAFLDSDDQLPVDAYSAMISTLERSGSDFAIGMLKRDEPSRRFAMPLMRDNHSRRRVGITLDEMPAILADVFAVNKVFRRSFWDDAGLQFPVNIRYEDQPTLTRAFLAAKRFDVLRETVYLWRIRHDGSSITQRRNDIDDLHDRIVTKRVSTELVMERAPHLEGSWRADILPVDLWEYFRAVPGCSEEYWALLRSAMAEFWGDTTVPFERTRVPVHQRLMGWHVSQGRRADLAPLIAFIDAQHGDLPIEVRDDHVVALLPGIDDPTSGIPQELFVLGEHELRWETRLTEATWQGDLLTLKGFAFIRNVPTRGRETELSARLVGPREVATGEQRVIDLDLRAVTQPRATKFAGRPRQNYDDCGFECTVDVSAAVEHPLPAKWRLLLERRVEKIHGAGEVTSSDRPTIATGWHDIGVASGDASFRARLQEEGEGLVIEIRPV